MAEPAIAIPIDPIDPQTAEESIKGEADGAPSPPQQAQKDTGACKSD